MFLGGGFSVGKFYRKKQIDMKYVKKKNQSNLTLQVFNENFGKIQREKLKKKIMLNNITCFKKIGRGRDCILNGFMTIYIKSVPITTNVVSSNTTLYDGVCQ